MLPAPAALPCADPCCALAPLHHASAPVPEPIKDTHGYGPTWPAPLALFAPPPGSTPRTCLEGGACEWPWRARCLRSPRCCCWMRCVRWTVHARHGASQAGSLALNVPCSSVIRQVSPSVLRALHCERASAAAVHLQPRTVGPPCACLLKCALMERALPQSLRVRTDTQQPAQPMALLLLSSSPPTHPPEPGAQPTNHLDLEACVWLEEYLKGYKKCLIIISHSQVGFLGCWSCALSTGGQLGSQRAHKIQPP